MLFGVVCSLLSLPASSLPAAMGINLSYQPPAPLLHGSEHTVSSCYFLPQPWAEVAQLLFCYCFIKARAWNSSCSYPGVSPRLQHEARVKKGGDQDTRGLCKVGCKNPEYWFQPQTNADTHPTNPRLRGLILTADECQVQADKPGWVAGSLCRCISRALELKGIVRPEVTRQRYQGEICCRTWQNQWASPSPHQTLGLGWSVLLCIGLGNEREGGLSHQGHKPSLMRNVGLRAQRSIRVRDCGDRHPPGFRKTDENERGFPDPGSLSSGWL